MMCPTHEDRLQWIQQASASELRSIAAAVAHGNTHDARVQLEFGVERMLKERQEDSFAAGTLGCHDTKCVALATARLHGPHGILFYCAIHAAAYTRLVDALGYSAVEVPR